MKSWQHGSILIVTHGKNRGRYVETGGAFLDRLNKQSPNFAAQLTIYRTGESTLNLAGVTLIVFWLGDPLRQNYPECYAEAKQISEAAAAAGIPILNAPDAVSNTAKVRQAQLWAEARLPAARGFTVETKQDVLDVINETNRPMLLRLDGHSKRHIKTLSNPEQVNATNIDDLLPGILLEKYDLRQEHEEAGAPMGPLFAQFHHKARAFVFHEQVMPSHLFFSDNPIVCVNSCLFAQAERPRRALARQFGYRRKQLDALVEADLKYFSEDPLQKQTLVRAVKTLGLDFAAVDYSIRPDGNLILWEANPYFSLPMGDKSLLSKQRRAVDRVNQSFDWMADQILAVAKQSAPVRPSIDPDGSPNPNEQSLA